MSRIGKLPIEVPSGVDVAIDDRLVTSADKYGTVVSEIDIALDPKTGDVTQARADNVIVRTDRFAKDAAQTRLIATYEQLAAPLAKRVVGRVGSPLTRDESPAGEMPMGLVIADASLFPSPIGVNPAETIHALATRNAHHILQEEQRR